MGNADWHTSAVAHANCYLDTANVAESSPGDTIVLEWESKGDISASLYRVVNGRFYGSPWKVDTSGVFMKLTPTNATTPRFISTS